MKKTASVLLLIILLLLGGGLVFVYSLKQCYVRREMQQTLNESGTHYQKITLSLSEYQKSKINDDEIYVNKKMYDVKSLKFIGNNVELLVIHDSKEESILEKIKELASRTGQANNKIPGQLQRLLSLNYLFPNSNFSFFIPSFSIHIFNFPDLNIVSGDSDIPSPPPKLV